MVIQTDDNIDYLSEKIRRCIKSRYGNASDIANIELATLGGSNRTVLFDVMRASQPLRLVLRQETVPSEYSPFLPSDVQYRILNVVHEHGIPVPRPVFELEENDNLGSGYVVAAVPGETLPKRLLKSVQFTTMRARFLQQSAEILSKLHAIDYLLIPELFTLQESRDPLGAQIALYDRYGEQHPAIELAFRYLEKFEPEHGPKTFLHGDFRNGNMIVGGEGIRALLDWECAHVGGVMEEIGWFCARSWRFGRVELAAGGFGDRETFYRAYEKASGTLVDRESSRWWEIFGVMRWAVYNIMQSHGHLSDARRSPAFAACGRNTSIIEYDLLKIMAKEYD
jgi:aminoglycoside phosphotransferase (APT) family kinase protein